MQGRLCEHVGFCGLDIVRLVVDGIDDPAGMAARRSDGLDSRAHPAADHTQRSCRCTGLLHLLRVLVRAGTFAFVVGVVPPALVLDGRTNDSSPLLARVEERGITAKVRNEGYREGKAATRSRPASRPRPGKADSAAKGDRSRHRFGWSAARRLRRLSWTENPSLNGFLTGFRGEWRRYS